jgi:outer membrane protein assembly factor BamA
VAALKSYYRDWGFLDVNIEDHKSFSEDFTQAFIEFVINEGVRFKIRNIGFVGNGVLSEQQLRERA